MLPISARIPLFAAIPAKITRDDFGTLGLEFVRLRSSDMLVARRDPFHPGAQDNPHSNFDLDPRPARAPRLLRAMSALQMFGTLLAIPLGIGSAYTMYRANFSPETTCQSLRASIVLMLDKNVDAHTRHMLARHDVEAFEKSCADVDPDATAAFKTLLLADIGATAAHAEAKSVAVKQPEEKPREVVRKIEPAPALRKSIASESRPEPKVEVKAEVKAEQKSEPREAAVTDTAWLAAVRGALAAKEQEVKPVKAEPAAPVSIVAPHPLAVVPVAPPVAIVAPPLAPATNVATVPAPMQDRDHPVPPAAIPEQPMTNDVVAQHTAQPQRSSWIGHIPFVGKMLDGK
jgi:hypothetical protein